MHVIYVIDRPGWALDQIGALIAPRAEASGIRFESRTADAYHASPSRCDVLYLSFSGLYRTGFPYRKTAGAVISTIHDPCEISYFQDRWTWSRHPLFPQRLDHFARLSVLTEELRRAVETGYGRSAQVTPTFPPDAEALRAGRLARNGSTIRFFSSTNKPARFGFSEMLGRLRYPLGYLRDGRHRINPRQLAALPVRVGRKNIPLLERLERHLARRSGAASHFVHGPEVSRIPREIYLDRLHSADIYVCTSFMEGGPLPVMEAVLAGAAVITSDVGQVRDWVQDGVNGFICTTDSEFMRAADRYLDSPALLRSHQDASRRIGDSKQFDFEPWRRFLTGASG